MSNHDEEYMDDYDYYQHTGELSEYFEDEDEEEEYEEEIEYKPQTPKTMSNIKLEGLNELTELYDADAAKFGVKLKSIIYRNIDECITLFMEFTAIPNKRCSDSLMADVIVYDKDSCVFNKLIGLITAKSFKGLGVIAIRISDIKPADISRIVVTLQKV